MLIDRSVGQAESGRANSDSKDFQGALLTSRETLEATKRLAKNQ
ncbi:MAG: hypothetical protein NT023_04780 [Armatimonadetes bacterium]|nr:hypothetical protein [Armatimonadota bacterium]